MEVLVAHLQCKSLAQVASEAGASALFTEGIYTELCIIYGVDDGRTVSSSKVSGSIISTSLSMARGILIKQMLLYIRDHPSA